MKRAAYDADAVPFSLTKDQYRQGTRDIVYYYDKGVSEKRWSVQDLIKWIGSDDKVTKVQTQSGTDVDFFPTKKLSIPVDVNKVIELGMIPNNDTSLVMEQLPWNLRKKHLKMIISSAASSIRMSISTVVFCCEPSVFHSICIL